MNTCTTRIHKHPNISQNKCLKDTFSISGSKAPPAKKPRIANQPKQPKHPSSLLPTTTDPLQLPDFFNSDGEQSDFYGFPLEAVLTGVPSNTKFTYYIPQKWEHLFDCRQDEEDFRGFTKEELYVILQFAS